MSTTPSSSTVTLVDDESSFKDIKPRPSYTASVVFEWIIKVSGLVAAIFFGIWGTLSYLLTKAGNASDNEAQQTLLEEIKKMTQIQVALVEEIKEVKKEMRQGRSALDEVNREGRWERSSCWAKIPIKTLEDSIIVTSDGLNHAPSAQDQTETSFSYPLIHSGIMPPLPKEPSDSGTVISSLTSVTRSPFPTDSDGIGSRMVATTCFKPTIAPLLLLLCGGAWIFGAVRRRQSRR